MIGFLFTCGIENIIGEGDRLASSKFFEAAQAAGYDVTVALLRCPESLAKQRRDARGSEQNEQWLKGRITKTIRLATDWVEPEWFIDATQPMEQLLAILNQNRAVASMAGLGSLIPVD
jgi:hypothetical protein